METIPGRPIPTARSIALIWFSPFLGRFFFCSFLLFVSSCDANEKMPVPFDDSPVRSGLFDHGKGSFDIRRFCFFSGLLAPSEVSASVTSAEVVWSP